jgi:hypothetical protein
MQSDLENDENGLFDAVSTGSPVSAVIMEWFEDYETDPSKAFEELLNFIIRVLYTN